MCRVLAFLVAVLLLAPVVALSASAEVEALPDIGNAHAVYMLHLGSDRVVGQKNEKERIPAGASVKVLSGLVACEWLAGLLDESVMIREEMIAASSGKRYPLSAGEVYSWRELLLLALCGSYNDAYDVIAHCIGNGEQTGKANFVSLLNARAKELGAVATYIADPSGVADNSYTTAQDLSRIALAAAENDLYLSFAGAKQGQLADGSYIRNRNSLVSDSASGYGNSLCKGLCVGETANAGVTLVALTRKENDSYLLILMDTVDEAGNASEALTYRLANRLLSWGYRSYAYTELLTPKTQVCTVPVTVSDMTSEVAVCPADSLWVYLPNGCTLGQEVVLSIRLSCEELEAPVEVGTPVGYAAAIYEGQIIGTVSLVTAESAERGSFVSGLLLIRSLTKSRRVRAGSIFFAVCMCLWIGGETYLRRKRRAKWRRYDSSRSRWQ